MGAMNVDDRHTDRVEERSAPDHADFEAALAERYRRLSLLTLNLAEEAGAAAVNFSLVDTKGVRPAFFDRRPAREGAQSLDLAAFAARAMTRAIWAHRVIERLRGGAPGEKAATLMSGAKPVREDDAWDSMQSTEPFPDDGWTPRSSRGESEIVVTGAVEKTTGNKPPTRHGPAANAAYKEDDAKAASLRASAHSRAGMASMPASEKIVAGETQSPEPRPNERWTPRSSHGESGLVSGGVGQEDGVRIDMLGAEENPLNDPADLSRYAQNLSNQPPTRHGLTMASMPASEKIVAGETQSLEPRPNERWTPRPSRGNSEILVAGSAERDVGVRGDASDDDKPAFGPVFGRRRFFSPP